MKLWIHSAAVGAALVLAPLALAQDVPREQLPEAVRRTLDREIGQAQVGEIERDREGGTTIYEVELVENGRRYELDISEDGRVLRRHPD
ncbi:PepSY domain-containing protein [Sandaracinus amylolyticus]|uniref:Putative beta-lactamase-inhibitor-like PepSY-like domain-containing protein n=1 Tax=Sandaracinus amylolyticus TaxID=927083 RepID=A0A0F6SDA8_9BACT|nr:PepSY-like domain-containing protein [Sandaracinus amylolyticus]AKF03119.1 hypothetical protein DB32_000268 [Sandaracinus amylolyticus]